MGAQTADEPIWRTARRCETGACVAIGIRDKIVMVRRSDDPDGPCIILSSKKWHDFAAGVKDGYFDHLS